MTWKRSIIIIMRLFFCSLLNNLL